MKPSKTFNVRLAVLCVYLSGKSEFELYHDSFLKSALAAFSDLDVKIANVYLDHVEKFAENIVNVLDGLTVTDVSALTVNIGNTETPADLIFSLSLLHSVAKAIPTKSPNYSRISGKVSRFSEWEDRAEFKFLQKTFDACVNDSEVEVELTEVWRTYDPEQFLVDEEIDEDQNNAKNEVESFAHHKVGDKEFKRSTTYNSMDTVKQLNLNGLLDYVADLHGFGNIPQNFLNSMTNFTKKEMTTGILEKPQSIELYNRLLCQVEDMRKLSHIVTQNYEFKSSVGLPSVSRDVSALITEFFDEGLLSDDNKAPLALSMVAHGGLWITRLCLTLTSVDKYFVKLVSGTFDGEFATIVLISRKLGSKEDFPLRHIEETDELQLASCENCFIIPSGQDLKYPILKLIRSVILQHTIFSDSKLDEDKFQPLLDVLIQKNLIKRHVVRLVTYL